MSYVENCYIRRRTADKHPYLFEVFPDRTMGVYLDGYAIVPKEDLDINYIEQVDMIKAHIRNFKLVFTLTPEMEKLCQDIEAILKQEFTGKWKII